MIPKSMCTSQLLLPVRRSVCMPHVQKKIKSMTSVEKYHKPSATTPEALSRYAQQQYTHTAHQQANEYYRPEVRRSDFCPVRFGQKVRNVKNRRTRSKDRTDQTTTKYLRIEQYHRVRSVLESNLEYCLAWDSNRVRVAPFAIPFASQCRCRVIMSVWPFLAVQNKYHRR